MVFGLIHTWSSQGSRPALLPAGWEPWTQVFLPPCCPQGLFQLLPAFCPRDHCFPREDSSPASFFGALGMRIPSHSLQETMEAFPTCRPVPRRSSASLGPRPRAPCSCLAPVPRPWTQSWSAGAALTEHTEHCPGSGDGEPGVGMSQGSFLPRTQDREPPVLSWAQR